VRLFAKRLGIIALTIVGGVTYFVVVSHVYTWLENIHLSESFRTVIAWIGLIVIAGCLIYLVWSLCVGLWAVTKWLFIEPFCVGTHKRKRKGVRR
jgi:hypothetical protein